MEISRKVLAPAAGNDDDHGGNSFCQITGHLSDYFRCGACKPICERILYESLNEASFSCVPRFSQRSDSPCVGSFPMSSVAPSPPEQGQLVNVRRRHCVETEVAKSTLRASPLHSSDNAAQHLVSLSSVEDDALGEELQVIWEIEPGAQVIETKALPRERYLPCLKAEFCLGE